MRLNVLISHTPKKVIGRGCCIAPSDGSKKLANYDVQIVHLMLCRQQSWPSQKLVNAVQRICCDKG